MAQFPVTDLSSLPVDQDPNANKRQVLEDQEQQIEQNIATGGGEAEAFASGSTDFNAPKPRNVSMKEDDIGSAYAAMAQARESDVNINDFRERIRRRRQQENPAPEPAASEAPGAGTPTGASAPNPEAPLTDAPTKITVTPFYRQPTVAEIAASAWNSVKNSTPKEREDAFNAVVKDVFKGAFVESAPSVVRGINVGAKEFVSSIADVADWASSLTGTDPAVQELTGNQLVDKIIQKPVRAAADALPGGEGTGEPTTVTGNLIQEAARFIVGFVPAIKVIKGTGAVIGGTANRVASHPIFQSVFGGAAAEMLTRPPNDPNLSNLIQMMPALANPVNEFLAADPNDSKALNKLRAGIEGLGFGILAEGITLGVRSLALKGRVVPEIEAQRRIYGDVPEGEVIGAGAAPDAGVQVGERPMTLNIATPEARAAAEQRLREVAAIAPAARPVYEDVLRQLREAGIPEEEAHANAAVWAARYQTRAERLGNAKTAQELYNEEAVSVERTDATIFDFNRISGDAKMYAGATLEKTSRPLADDRIGTIAEKQQAFDAISMVRSGALTVDQLDQLPIIQRAIKDQANPSEGLRPEQITPEHRANAVFDFDGEQVVGYDEAIKRLKSKAEGYAGDGVRHERKAAILIGPPAAGKSTIAKDLALARGAAVPDSDDVKFVMPEMKTKGSGHVHEESTFINSEVVGELVGDGANLVLPKIGHNPESIRALANILMERGYQVDLVNMMVRPEENYLRMVQRFLETGRWVDLDYLRSIGDKPLNTYNAIKAEGAINGSTANFDNNGRVLRLADGNSSFEAEINASRARRSGNRVDDRSNPAQPNQDAPDRPGDQVSADQFAQLEQTPVRDYKRVVSAEPADPNYVYYPANLQTAEWIARNGRVPLKRPFEVEGTDTWMDGSNELRAYFSTDTTTAGVEGGKPVLLRVSRGKQVLNTEKGSKDIYSNRPVQASNVEFLGADGVWRPIADSRQREFAQQQTRQFAPEVPDNGYRDVDDATVENVKSQLRNAGRLNEDGTVTLYHVTTTENAESIAQEGLVPGKEPAPGQPWKAEHSDYATYYHGDKDAAIANQEQMNDLVPDSAKVVEVRYPIDKETLGRILPDEDVSSNPSDGVKALIDGEAVAVVDGAKVEQITQFFQRAPAFYSSVEQAINGAKQPKASGSQWLNTIKNTPGVKGEELSWTGLDKWLTEQGKKQVTKEDVQKFFADNKVEINEVQKSEGQHFRTESEARKYLEEISGDDDYIDDTLAKGDSSEMVKVANEYWNELGDETSTKFGPTSSYNVNVPGGENYRELLLTLTPSKEDQAALSRGFSTKEASQRQFRGGHFDEPNVLAHVRTDDRVIDGKKTLFIEEIQSDWHQQGRKKGYREKPDTSGWVAREVDGDWEIADANGKAIESIPTSQARTRQEAIAIASEQTHLQGVPDAPFKKTWHELALKRIIRQAADEGYDQIAWTSGKIQNERYDLSKQVERIHWTRQEDGTYNITGETKGLRQDFNYTSIVEKDLSDYVGKDHADRIIKNENAQQMSDGRFTGTFEGEDLKIGGKGMIGFYDKMLVKAANDLAKPFGGKVGKAEIEGGSRSKTADELRKYIASDPDHTDIGWGMRESDANDVIKELEKIAEGKSVYKDAAELLEDTVPGGSDFEDVMRLANSYVQEVKSTGASRNSDIHTLELTPRLKATAQEQGFKLFQEGEAPAGWQRVDPINPAENANAHPKGLISFKDNETLVTLFRTADQSTFMHESGHLWLDEMVRDAALTDAPKQIKDDFAKVLDWFKIESPDQIGRTHHEQWARGFEQYLASGKAPTPGLQGAFERFKDWLLNIYKSLRNIGDTQITDEVKGVMDRMLGGDADIAMVGKQALDHQGFTPEGAAYYGPRLRQLGYDSVVFEGAQLVGEQAGRAISIMPRRSAVGVASPDLGVPTDVAAKGVARSAEDFANTVGVARVLRADTDPQHRAPGQEVFINFGRINTADDIKQALRDLADADKGAIDEARRGVITHEQTARMADDLGMTVDDLLNRRAGSPMNAEEMLAARNLLTTSGAQVLEASKRASIPNATLADQYNFLKLVGVHTAIQREVIAARTEAARSLSAMRIMATDSNVAMAREIQAILDAHGGNTNVARLAQTLQDLSAAGVPAAAMNMAVKKGFLATTSDAMKEVFTSGLLWLPPTHMVNVASNLVVAGAQIYERGAAKVMADLMGAPVGSRVVDGEALAMTFGMMTSFKDAFRMAAASIKNDPVHMPAASKFADKELGALGAHIWSRERGHSAAQAQEFAESPMGRFLDFVGNTIRLPYRALAAEDEFAKAITWRMEASAQAMRQAVEEGLEGDAKWSRIIDLINNPPETVSLAAADAALYTTFQSKIGTIGQGLMVLRSGPLSLPVTMVLPFVKTPTNILRYSFERTPLAPLVAQWREDISSGGPRQQIALARMATGTAIIALAFDMAQNGQITGSGPADPGKKEALLRTGWQPSSVVSGDGKYYSFNRADPYAMLFTFAATTTELMKRSDLSPEDYDQLSETIAAAIGIVSQAVVDKTYFQGISQAFAALSSAEKGSQGVSNFINRQTGSLLPGSSAFNMTKRFVDPVTREFTDPWESVMSKIAGLSERLPAARDIWGAELKPQEVYGRAWDILSPVRVAQETNSAIDKELVRLDVGLRRITKKGTFDGADVNFYDFPQVFERYVVLAGNELKHPVYGVGAKDFLDSVVSGNSQWSEIYKLMPDNKEGKGAWIKNRIEEYRALAQQQIMREEADQWPEFVAWVNARKQQRMELKLPAGMQLELPTVR